MAITVTVSLSGSSYSINISIRLFIWIEIFFSIGYVNLGGPFNRFFDVLEHHPEWSVISLKENSVNVGREVKVGFDGNIIDHHDIEDRSKLPLLLKLVIVIIFS